MILFWERIVYKVFASVLVLLLCACAPANVPEGRNVDIPVPRAADERREGVNEHPDSVMYLPLGEDVLVPEEAQDVPLPSGVVGPFELRGETLAGALQLILADYDVSLAFESDEGMSRRITVANLKGELDDVVNHVCSLADLYCDFDGSVLTVKDTQMFAVTLPPIGDGADDSAYMDNIADGLAAVLGSGGESSGGSSSSGGDSKPIVDPTTRTIVYSASQRTSDMARRYFQRLRANTAMIVFETYIWEVSLNSGNSMGIDWSRIEKFAGFKGSVKIDGSVAAGFTNPISIGLPTTQDIGENPAKVVDFLSQFGAVKTVSQPQITVLSGSSAVLRVADTENYVSQITTTVTDSQSTTAVTTGSVDSGFTLSIDSSWDRSTVYAKVNMTLTNVGDIKDFTFSDGGSNGTSTIIQLPQTSERQVTTQIRVRPGDSVLMAGLVREKDDYDTKGVGFMKPVVPHSRTTQTQNLELVVLMRPRVVVYAGKNDKGYREYVARKRAEAGKTEDTSIRTGGADDNVSGNKVVSVLQSEGGGKNVLVSDDSAGVSDVLGVHGVVFSEPDIDMFPEPVSLLSPSAGEGGSVADMSDGATSRKK